MKKPYKVLSATTLAGMLAASSLVPVVALADTQEVPAEAKKLAEVGMKAEDGKSYKVSFEEEYVPHFLENPSLAEKVTHIIAGEGSTYDFEEEYVPYFLEYGSVEKTLEALYRSGNKLDELEEGKFENGEVVADEQPEDRLNETFFYNVA